MTRITSETTFFRWEGVERKDIYWRIAPQAIRFQQGRKVAVVDTLGGYYKEVFYARDPQYSGLTLPSLTVEGTSGAGYRKSFQDIDWIRKHISDRKRNGAPSDLYFFSLSRIGPLGELARDVDFGWLIEILDFAWDDSASQQNEIKFSLRMKILRDLFWETNPADFEATGEVPTLEELMAGQQGKIAAGLEPASGRSDQEQPENVAGAATAIADFGIG